MEEGTIPCTVLELKPISIFDNIMPEMKRSEDGALIWYNSPESLQEPVCDLPVNYKIDEIMVTRI